MQRHRTSPFDNRNKFERRQLERTLQRRLRYSFKYNFGGPSASLSAILSDLAGISSGEPSREDSRIVKTRAHAFMYVCVYIYARARGDSRGIEKLKLFRGNWTQFPTDFAEPLFSNKNSGQAQTSPAHTILLPYARHGNLFLKIRARQIARRLIPTFLIQRAHFLPPPFQDRARARAEPSFATCLRDLRVTSVIPWREARRAPIPGDW